MSKLIVPTDLVYDSLVGRVLVAKAKRPEYESGPEDIYSDGKNVPCGLSLFIIIIIIQPRSRLTNLVD